MYPEPGEELLRQSQPRGRLRSQEDPKDSYSASSRSSSRSCSCDSCARSNARFNARFNARSRSRRQRGRASRRPYSRSPSREGERRRRSPGTPAPRRKSSEEKPWFKKKTVWSGVASIATVAAVSFAFPRYSMSPSLRLRFLNEKIPPCNSLTPYVSSSSYPQSSPRMRRSIRPLPRLPVHGIANVVRGLWKPGLKLLFVVLVPGRRAPTPPSEVHEQVNTVPGQRCGAPKPAREVLWRECGVPPRPRKLE